MKLEEQSKKLDLLQQDMNAKGQLLDKVTNEQLINSNRTFETRNFSVEKAKEKPGDWKSLATYTHLHGYKFSIGVDANGFSYVRWCGISVLLYVMAGEYDEDLKWPVEATFTVGLTSQPRPRNKEYSTQVRWDRPNKATYDEIRSFGNISFLSANLVAKMMGYILFIKHSD